MINVETQRRNKQICKHKREKEDVKMKKKTHKDDRQQTQGHREKRCKFANKKEEGRIQTNT